MPSAIAERLRELGHVTVTLDGREVGTLARNRQGRMLFEYAAGWLNGGFSISPFSLPLQAGLFEANPDMPDGLFGIFRDSLPDDWGRLLQDRRLAQLGVRPGSLSSLARLALVGATGLGALEYAPSQMVETEHELSDDWDVLSQQCQAILGGDSPTDLDGIYARGSSSGGARPKVMVDLDGDPWIVKFPASVDGPNAGVQEYELAHKAMDCGIVMSKVRLLPSEVCGGYFATRRFDRIRLSSGEPCKVHMASAAALLEVSPFDVLDYRDLMRLTLQLTDSVSDCEQLFRIMCFNVAVGNCDDHARNFSYLYDKGAWRISPAYDITQDTGFLGEHSTLVNGKGADITKGDLLRVGVAGGLSVRKGRQIIARVSDVTGVKIPD